MSTIDDNQYNDCVSVIVPVYNVERYIRRCIDSIIGQSYKNIEIFLVDDGSTDSSGHICDEYAKVDSRITVIHKLNGGLSQARNVAYDKTNGKYIVYIDSDDWVSEYYIEHLYTAITMNDADMSMSWFWDVQEDSNKEYVTNQELKNLDIIDSEACLEKLLYQDHVETSAWGKMYKRSILEGLKYPEGELYEDIVVTITAIHNSDKIAVIGNKDYFYFHRKDGIQLQTYSHRKMDAIKHMSEAAELIKKIYNERLNTALSCRFLSIACNIIFQIDDRNEYKDDFECLWDIIKKNRNVVLFDRKARRKSRIAAIVSLFGYKTLEYVYKKTQSRA